MKFHASLAISISDTSISTGIIVHAKTKKGEEPKKPLVVSYRTSAFSPNHDDLTIEYLESRIKVLLKQILHKTRYEDLVKAKLTVRHIKKVVVSVSAPWFDARTIVHHLKEAKEFRITDAIIKKIFDIEAKSIASKDSNGIALLENTVLSTTLNGYTVANPIGMIATSVSVVGYISYIKKEIDACIRETVDAFFHGTDEIIIKSEPLLLLAAAMRESEIMGIGADFVIVRINEIVTHIQVVRGGHMKEIGTIPFGIEMMLKKVSETFSSTQETSWDVFNLYLNNALEGKYTEKMKEVLNPMLDQWKDGIKEFSIKSIESGKLPSTVFLSSPTSASELFKSYLLKDNYLDLTMSEKQLNIEILDRKSLDEFLDFTEGVKDPGFLTKLIALI